MAEIFRGKAVAAGGFEKPVAIKRILPHLSQDKRFVELLIAEAKVLSLLKHRNIVQIFDVGLGDDGKYFLVMEYVDGKDLGAVQRGLEARRRRMPFDLALHVGAEVCEALEHAHSARAPDGKPMSLVHRDVSPSNVLLSRAGEVKLTDFGIAKRAEQESTGHGAVRGKFAYISPEQARNEHIEPRSDVFSIGILLWELVTSRRLFSGLTDMEALRAVRDAQVPRPREFDGRLSPEIDTLIMSTLAPEPRGRPTAGQLGAKLRSLRYSLEVTVGDPATELAKIIDTAEEVERQSSSQPLAPAVAEFEGSEATVIRIHTADAFSMRDKDGAGMARAREVIDRFEEEETRQAMLSRDQMAFLRAHAQRDSGELSHAIEPPLPGVRRISEEQTQAHAPVPTDDPATRYPKEPGDSFDADEATRLLAPPGMRTPPPDRPRPRLASQPPPMPADAASARPRPASPGPPADTPSPGTVHDRSGRGALPPGTSAAPVRPGPPSLAVTPVLPQPPVLPPPPMPPPAMGAGLAPPPMLPSAMGAGLGPPGMQAPMQLSGMGPSGMAQPQAMPPGMQQPGMPPPGMQQPGMPPPGMQPPGMPPGMPQPGMQPGMPQPGMQPGMPQPGMPPGMPQPGMQAGPQPGMPQPGMPQPGVPQPGMSPRMQQGMQRGMQQPGMPAQAMPSGMPSSGLSSGQPGNYAGWGLQAQMPLGASPAVQAMYDRQPPHRPSTASPHRFGRHRRTPLRPWMLAIGALIMALLAFVVTRACIHSAPSKPAAEAR
jgi:serine/threonine-protein kinase